MKYCIQHFVIKIATSVFCFATPCFLYAQQPDVLQYVNPFIGTAKSNVYTKWGNEGGTYPGAVAPWGFIQLSPETRSSGYDYKDSSLLFFSCLQHHSGFPGGSGGRLHIMPVTSINHENEKQSFDHKNEQAQPGYYAVEFNNKIKVEATASAHAGIFRIAFPFHVVPNIFIGDAGELSMSSAKTIKAESFHVILHFDRSIKNIKKTKGGYLIQLLSARTGTTIITIQLSASLIGYESAQQNMDAELSNLSFDEVRAKIQSDWKKELSVVAVADSSNENKTCFYTALYHSLLLPWIISDVNGNYPGSDNRVHKTNGKNEYGGFSPWDTFRSLHPLLSLLYPERQADMVSSMLDSYRQSGYLPVESMTGNHSIPILVDSYLKGVKPEDSSLLYTAMKKSIVEGPFLQPDMLLYQQGFIPYPHTESVTRTVEYAYDDWVLAQYAKDVMHDDSLFAMLTNRSRNYRYLFNADELSLLPKKDSAFYLQKANAGYKEGDQWVYSLFLPQYQRDLINLMGGDENFIQNIAKEFADNRLVFDNETMFSVPYLFNSTAYPYKTQQWIAAIRKRFSATPGGLPGNDDLGATSSWFVWSALGLYPVCPGNPVYAAGTPFFKEAVLYLPNGKQLHIAANNLSESDFYVRRLFLNGEMYNKKWISHKDITKGGQWVFSMDHLPDTSLNREAMPKEADSAMRIRFSDVSVQLKTVMPDEPFWIAYSISNQGGSGTAIAKLRINDSLSVTKNCFIRHNETKRDSVQCRLYAYGNHIIQLADLPPLAVQVSKASDNNEPYISNLQVDPLAKKGKKLYYNYTVKNKSGIKTTVVMPVKINGKTLLQDTVMLPPGDSVLIHHQLTANTIGWYTLTIGNEGKRTKIYTDVKDALVLNMTGDVMDKRTVQDESGFANNGYRSAFGNYIELPHTASLDSNGTTLTMMAWIYDTGTTKPYTELLAKGDNHVLQLVNGKSLTFFAGGWGRGDCTVPLPADWSNRWHLIAGVCNGHDLRVYMDGRLQGTTPLEEMINLDVAAGWTIGSNEEFPLDRTFEGRIKGVKIYAAPLSAQDVMNIYLKEKMN